MTVARIAKARRRGQPLRVILACQTGLIEVRPELELELELGRVAPEEERLEEGRRLRVRTRSLVRQPKVLGVPRGLTGDRLADVRVDLGQRMIAREPAERVGQIR